MDGEPDRSKSTAVRTTFPAHRKIHLDKIFGFLGELKTAIGNWRETVASRSEFIRGAYADRIVFLKSINDARMHEKSKVLI